MTEVWTYFGTSFLGALFTGFSSEGLKIFAEETSEETASSTLGTVLAIVDIYMWVKMGYDMINAFVANTKTVTIETQCMPWVPLRKTTECEKCNPDYWKNEEGNPTHVNALKTCSEYRCKSLGATCELLNKGTENETCVSISQYDVNSPQIKPWEEGMSEEYREVKEFDFGFELVKELPIYQKVTLAIETDEPAQCKMSFEHGKRYEDMESIYFGGPSYKYYHTQTIFYPASKNYTEEGLKLVSGGEYNIYVRCVDGAGNANERDYVIRFKVSEEPDLTPPVIELSNVGGNNAEIYLGAGVNETEVWLMVNEPAECRWAFNNMLVNAMPADHKCIAKDVNALGYYECRFSGNNKIKGLNLGKGQRKPVYFMCKDRSKGSSKDGVKGNPTREPFVLWFMGTEPLNISDKGPEGEIVMIGDVKNVSVWLRTSNGAEAGKATCKYSFDEQYARSINMMEEFLNTNSNEHSQEFLLREGEHRVFVGCVDKAGNVAYDVVEFSLVRDLDAPNVVAAYLDENGLVGFVLDERAVCQYSVEGKFDFEKKEGVSTIVVDVDGKKHSVSDVSNYYYVVCQDDYGNKGSFELSVLGGAGYGG